MQKKYTSIGLMSGTSGDGIDASVISSNGLDQFEVIKNKYFEYDSKIYKQIHQLKNQISKKFESGLRDAFKEIDKKKRSTAISEIDSKCKEMFKISLTHDPAGAFHKDVTGLVISGHTHCGQIRFPLIGSLWVPTEAPSKAHCGLYKDSQRTVFTTSGIGTALLPLRIGTQAQWDFLTIEIGS